MEATYYKDMLSERGEGVVETSVIHTAPGCKSVLDSDHEEGGNEGDTLKRSPPSVEPDDDWTPTNSSVWENPVLRISINRDVPVLPTFPNERLRLSNPFDGFG
ncbi:hypothetical protein AB6A40_002244 [Gnathostoma spinigerum]|uniref:Uncharacterized protein n=1 Tax=Gnathostoma spinigerum TaxID=75299 RepID=A0ABD6E769_9BILA